MIRANTWWKYQFSHSISRWYLFGIGIVALVAILLSQAETASPVAQMSDTRRGDSTLARTNLITTNPASKIPPAQPAAFHLTNDVNILQQQAMLEPDKNNRVQAAQAMNLLRRQWSAAMGVSSADWHVAATTPQNANKIVVAVRRDLYLSADGGQTFKQEAHVLPGALTTLAISPADENVMYAGVDGLGFYVSVDGGQSWQPSNTGIQVTPGARFGITAITINPADARNMYIASGVWMGTGAVTYYPLGILKTYDGGKTWTPLETEAVQPIQYLYLDASTLHVWSNGQHRQYRVN